MFNEDGDLTKEYRGMDIYSSYFGEFGTRLRKSNSENDLACFAAFLAQEGLLEFTQHMRSFFGVRAKIGAKTGTARIADKIMADSKERGISLKAALGSLSDLLRLSVSTPSPAGVI